MKFTEATLEKAFTELLGSEGYPHLLGNSINRSLNEVLIEEDLLNYLLSKYKRDQLLSRKQSLSFFS